MIENCYKVVYRFADGRLASAVQNAGLEGDTDLTVTYVPDKPAKPPAGKLFVFRSLRKAKKFRNRNANQEIWAAYGTRLKKLEWMASWAGVNLDIAEKFWAALAAPVTCQTFDDIHAAATPDGTFMADNVTLLRRVL